MTLISSYADRFVSQIINRPQSGGGTISDPNSQQSGGGTVLGSGSARLSGALCLAPFEKLPFFSQIRSGSSGPMSWHSWSANWEGPNRGVATVRIRGWHHLEEQHGATRESSHVPEQPCHTYPFMPMDASFRPTTGRNRRVAPFWGAVQRGCLALSDWRPLRNCRDFRRPQSGGGTISDPNSQQSGGGTVLAHIY